MTNTSSLPKHLGVIMDGNGRWAKARGLVRSKGHKEGLKAAKEVVKSASKLGIPFVSLYVFSTENWKRTEEEVSYLMYLLKHYLKKEYQFYLENQIRVVHSGDFDSLPREIQKEIQDVVEATKDFTGLTVNLLINYGGRDEILRAFARLKDSTETEIPDEETFYKYLDQPTLPPLDLIIRTAGEQRLSNFLIWQAAYAEYYFTDKLWPDFSEDELINALEAYKNRKRKFGAVL